MKLKENWRFILLPLVLVFFWGVIMKTMVTYQFSEVGAHFKENQARNQYDQVVLYPPRGQIFDIYGHVLAGNERVFEVTVNMKEIGNSDPFVYALAFSQYLGLEFSEVFEMVSDPPHDMYQWYVAKYVDEATVDKLIALQTELEEEPVYSSEGLRQSLEAVYFYPHLQRSYPEKSLAANVLGFVNYEKKGNYGVEELYDDLLTGRPETIAVPHSPTRVQLYPELNNGASLILTIDRSLQAEVEEILDKALENTGSVGGTIVVMHPETGEIMAMASAPRFDINEFYRHVYDTFEEDQAFNMAITSYEPGSVFKVITMAAALDSGMVTPDTEFIDTGEINVGGHAIHNWDLGAWGPQTMTGCMQHSLNVCLAWVATELGAGTFYDYIQDFGFGHATGISLSQERTGKVKLPGYSDWYEVDLGTNSFGQGLSVTPVQMLMSISAVANDGHMVVPRIVHAVIDDGRQLNTTSQVSNSPISEKTARTLTDMLSHTLEEEASTALVEGYRISGKTGTAQIPIPGGYEDVLTNASFVGWGPSDDPKFMVYVWLQKPTVSPWGSVVAAPVFRQVAERVVVHMNIPPDKIRLSLDGDATDEVSLAGSGR